VLLCCSLDGDGVFLRPGDGIIRSCGGLDVLNSSPFLLLLYGWCVAALLLNLPDTLCCSSGGGGSGGGNGVGGYEACCVGVSSVMAPLRLLSL
jgi:hypothetical protein